MELEPERVLWFCPEATALVSLWTLEYKSLALVLLSGSNKSELVPQIYWAYVDAGARELSFGKRDDRDKVQASRQESCSYRCKRTCWGLADSLPKYI